MKHTKPKKRPRRWNSTIAADTNAKPRKRSPVKKKNPARIKKRREEAYGLHSGWVRGRRCFVCEKHGWPQRHRTVAAHAAKTRGAGGKAPDIVDLCTAHEEAWHYFGRHSFDKANGVDCKARAAYLWSISPHNPDNAPHSSDAL